MRTTAKPETVIAALAAINWKHYRCNVRLRDMTPLRRGCRFTITVDKSTGPGARRAPSGRCVAAACWHAHGHLFESILEIEPDAVIYTELLGNRRITKDGGNWQDAQVGSQFNPVMFSELCDCGNPAYVAARREIGEAIEKAMQAEKMVEHVVELMNKTDK